jgi:RimJ/RimL family protein N-acetyltransferase
MIEGPSVILRLFAESDLGEFFKLDADVAARGEFFPISLRSPAVSRKQFKETGWWEEDQGRMLITTRDGRMVGTIFFFKGMPYRAGYEIGYYIFRSEDRGKGYMSEALRIFSAYLFELKPVPRLELGVDPGNAPSRRVAEKCGFKLEGVMRKQFFCRGGYKDCEVLSLLREECPTVTEALKA